MKKIIIAIGIISAILFAIGTFTIIVSAAENTVASQTIMGGTITLTAEKTSDTTITLTIENNFEKEVSTSGYPEIILNGIQQELDKHLQLKNGTQRLSVPAGEVGQITYYVSDANSVEALIGKLFCMGYHKSDDEFSLEFNGDTAPVQTESGAVTTTSSEENQNNNSNESQSENNLSDSSNIDDVNRGTYNEEDSFEQNKNRISNQIKVGRMIVNIGFIIIPVFLILILAFGIRNNITTNKFSEMSIKKKELPERRQTANTITQPNTDNKPYVLPIINGRVPAQEAERIINEWFAENPYVYNCRLKLESDALLNDSSVTEKFYVKKAVIEYFVSDTPQVYQYGLAFIYKQLSSTPEGYDVKHLVSEWQANNADCKIISTHGAGKMQHSRNGGSLRSEYYNYVFFRK